MWPRLTLTLLPKSLATQTQIPTIQNEWAQKRTTPPTTPTATSAGQTVRVKRLADDVQDGVMARGGRPPAWGAPPPPQRGPRCGSGGGGSDTAQGQGSGWGLGGGRAVWQTERRGNASRACWAGNGGVAIVMLTH